MVENNFVASLHLNADQLALLASAIAPAIAKLKRQKRLSPAGEDELRALLSIQAQLGLVGAAAKILTLTAQSGDSFHMEHKNG